MAQQQATPSRYRYVIAGLTLALNLSIGLSFFAISPLLPLIVDDYSISRTDAGLLSGLAILIQAAFGIPGGFLAVRLGLKPIFAAGWLLAGAMVLTPLADNFATLVALRVVFALGVAVLFPATGPLLMRWFKPREYSVMTALNWAASSLGMAISMFTAAPLAEALGWQGALAVFGGVTLLGAMAWLALGRAGQTKATEAPKVSMGELRRAIFSRVTLLMALADGAGYAQYAALTTWLPTYYSERLGLSLTQVGFITGFLPFAGMIGVLLGGILPAFTRARRPFIVVPGLLLCLAGFGSFITGNLAIIYISLLAVGFASWFYGPTLFTLPMELPGASQARVAMAWSVVAAVASVMAFSSPLTVGALADSTGSYMPGFTLWAIFSLVMAVAGMLLPMPKASRPQESGRAAIHRR